MKHLVRICLLTAAVVAAIVLCPQQSVRADSPESPSDVVNAAFGALFQLDIENYAGYMHPEALSRLKAMLWPAVVAKPTGDTANTASALVQLLALEVVDDAPVDISPPEFFVKLMSALMRISPDLRESMKLSKHEVLGEVAENDSLVHCVLRVSVTEGEKTGTKVELITVKRSEDGWKLMLSTDLEAAAARLGRVNKK